MKNQSRTTFVKFMLLSLTVIVGVLWGWMLRDTRAIPAAQVSSRPTTPAISRSTQQAQPAAIKTAAPAPTAISQSPVAVPSAVSLPLSPTEEVNIIGYTGHLVASGETLQNIADAGGSTPELIAQYNHLTGPPQPGRALIVPQRAGQTNRLKDQPLLVQRGRSDKPWVALTLDAGASAEPVPRILETLRAHHVHITFFLTGKWITDNPDLTRQIVADGHEIGNHTLNHPDLTRLDDMSVRQELAATDQLMRETTGTGTKPFFRPPYGAYDTRVLHTVEDEGYLPIYWTFDSLDSVGAPKTPEFLFERITTKLSPEQLRGAIILAHCGSAPTADALPRILDRFAEMGFEVKKLSEVLDA